MFYVYILKSRLNDQIYLGSTNDLKKRFKAHNDGEITSSKRYKPWSLLYYEAYPTEKLARIREKKLKYYGNSIKELKKRVGILKSGAGFTIIELIVVISVIAILSVIGIASFVSFGRVQALETSASEIVSYLNLAKSRSLSQVKPQSCTDQTTLKGYKVVLNLSSQSYELDAICSSFSYKIEGKTLPKNITFDSVNTTSTSFFFPVIVGGVIVDGVQGSKNIVIQGYGRSKTIIVDSIGGIR